MVRITSLIIGFPLWRHPFLGTGSAMKQDLKKGDGKDGWSRRNGTGVTKTMNENQR
jgi:hypothetical protein